MGFDPNESRDDHGMWSKGPPVMVARNLVEPKRELTPAESQSIKDYMIGGAYHDLNDKLRKGQEPSGSLKRIQEHLDAAIASHSLKSNSVLYRGLDENMDHVLAGIDKQGGTLKDLGFTSTATNYHDVGLIADSNNVLKIHSAAGKNALAVAIQGMGYTEVILPRQKTLVYMHKNLNDNSGFDYHFRNR